MGEREEIPYLEEYPCQNLFPVVFGSTHTTEREWKWQ